MNRYPKISSLILGSLALFACTKPKTVSSSVSAVTDGTFYIKSRMSGKCLDVNAGSIEQGVILQQWDCLNNNAQKFQVIPTSGGFVRITNVGSGKDLDALERGTNDGTAIQQYGYGGGDNQQWRLDPREEGSFAILGRASGRALDVSEKSMANGAKIQLWQDYNTANQQWFLIPAGSAPTTTPPKSDSWTMIHENGGAPIRSITRRRDGVLLGPVSTGHKIEVWASRDGGSNWTLNGSVVSNDRVEFGDPMMLAIPGTSTVFCAFREHLDGRWIVTVTRSDNDGDSWTFDSTIVGPVEPFVGAPFLFLANNGDLQIYYDSELLASQSGAPGHQYIAMQGRRGISGPWTAYGVVAASKIATPGAMSREGMATVVSLGGDRILLVTEGVEAFQTGGASSNEIHAIESLDGGRTWDHSLRRTVYSAKIDPISGKRFNAYVPYALRINNGPVGVAFCTDENFAGPPDASSSVVGKRRCHVKYVQTTSNFETWSASNTIFEGTGKNYTPGLFERNPNDLIMTVDPLGGGVKVLNK